jgi:glutamine---fructose-6-phosphate transaminase (isomerizing)
MCGIYGHIGSQGTLKKCLDGLKFLEYRGYDSSGIAGIEDDHLICYKEEGKIADLEKAIGNKIHRFQSAIGHTRWATHGKPTKLNAHPHLDQKKEIAIVHNGVLENYRTLRKMLEETGVTFVSETDSEVIAQLIAHFYQGDLLKAVRKATSLMVGFWGLAILHKNHPNQIVATRCENPIVVGISKEDKETYVSSDPHALPNSDLDLYFLENHQIALINQTDVSIYDVDDRLIEPAPVKLEMSEVDRGKGDFEHYLLKEIMEQPTSVGHSIQGRILPDLGDAHLEDISPNQLQEIEEILIIGCGTSYHAALIGAKQIQELSGIPARAEIASEYRYQNAKIRKKTLTCFLSQSGETFDTLAAMQKVKSEGGKVLAICNVPNSTLMREADFQILLRCGPEISVCSTKAFTSQLAVLSLLALKLGRVHGMTQVEGREFVDDLRSLPTTIQSVLNQSPLIESVAQSVATKSRFLFIGRQYMYPTCLEAALKLKEISYTSASGYPAGELKHGPIALIDPSSVVIALMGNEVTFEKLMSNLEEVKARNGLIVAFAPHDAANVKQVADYLIPMPKSPDLLSTFSYAVATQIFAYSVAHSLGREIDTPRNLAKSVTVE